VKIRHDEGVAIRIDPEPCGGAREGVAPTLPHVRFCERLGVKFPGPTRHGQ
jgi:hypothetical protein